MTRRPGWRWRAAAWAGAAVLGLCGLRAAGAHWLAPEDIIAGLRNNAPLRDAAGVTEVHRDPDLPRLLIVKVRRERWETVPGAERLRLAEEWLETWRHNVPQGIVAILDADTSASVVNFDGLGKARLVEHARPAGAPTESGTGQEAAPPPTIADPTPP